MVKTLTPVCDFGWEPSGFELLGVDGKHSSLKDCLGKNGTVVAFVCNHCPFVKAIQQQLLADARLLKEKGVSFVLINANDSTQYPEDSYEKMQQLSSEMQYPFPYLWDETQEVAQAWNAVCTPDFFGFNSQLELQYRGRLDDSGMRANPKAERELLNVMLQVAETGKGPSQQTPSVGCSIKWKT